MSNPNNTRGYPVCPTCGMTDYPPGRRPHGTDWYCTCPKDDDQDEPVRPRQVIPAADRELLALAARALGAVRVEDVEGENWVNLHFADGSTVFHWNPKVHSDDSLHLAVDLQMQVTVDAGVATVGCADAFAEVSNQADPRAAARDAIIYVAAEIGRRR